MDGRSETGGGIGKPVQRKEDLRLLTGKGHYVTDQQPARHGVCRDGSLAPRPRPHRLDRDRAGESRAGRHRRPHRRGLHRRRVEADGSSPHAGRAARRHGSRARGLHHLYPCGADAARRQGALCRRTGRDGGRRDPGSGERRRRAGRGRIRSASRRDHGGRRGEGRHAQGVGRGAVESLRRCRGRRQGGDRRGLRQGRSCHAARTLGCSASPARRWSRATPWAISMPRAGRYTLYAGTGSGVAKERVDLASVLGVPPEFCRAVVRRHGREFRHQEFLFSGIRAAALGGTADRAPGQMARRAAGSPSSATIRAAT